MRSRAERQLVVLMIVFSLLLTGITVWAVVQQGRALQARERDDLVNQAGAAAAQRRAALLAATELALDGAARAWDGGDTGELDAWTVGRRDWLLACAVAADGRHVIFPRPPLDQFLPRTAAVTNRALDPLGLPPLGPVEPPPALVEPGQEDSDQDPLSALRAFQPAAEHPDPLTRAAALLAEAARQRQLGHPLAATRKSGQAAQLLRETPRLARFAFQAEIARIDSLLAAGDELRTREAFSSLLTRLLADHPARLSPAETDRLAELATALGTSAEEPLATALAELRARARRRACVGEALEKALASRPAEPDAASGPVRFLAAPTADQGRIVIACRPRGADAWIALAAPTDDVLARYWSGPLGDVPWRVRSHAEQTEHVALVELGPEFGDAVIEPTPRAEARMRATQRRRVGLLLATTLGMAGAWALVIWMMVRVVARRHELARLQGRFVADVSHELKTPLALIRLLAETLADRRVSDPRRVQAYHETISRESERLTLLLDNILDLGRIESGRKKYEFAECDLTQVARQAWTLFEPRFAEEHFETRLEIDEDLPVIRADAQALQQVIVNLLQNAYRYSAEHKYVRLALAREGYVIVITVEDHGIGMNRGQLNRLGESFFRADDARVRQTRGAGLGLAIVNHIVTAHRGRMEVHSRPDQGSTFTVWVPFEPR